MLFGVIQEVWGCPARIFRYRDKHGITDSIQWPINSYLFDVVDLNAKTHASHWLKSGGKDLKVNDHQFPFYTFIDFMEYKYSSPSQQSKLQETTGNCKKLQETAGNCRKLQETAGNYRKLQETAGNYRKLHETAGNYRKLQETVTLLSVLARSKNSKKLLQYFLLILQYWNPSKNSKYFPFLKMVYLATMPKTQTFLSTTFHSITSWIWAEFYTLTALTRFSKFFSVFLTVTKYLSMPRDVHLTVIKPGRKAESNFSRATPITALNWAGTKPCSLSFSASSHLSVSIWSAQV